MTTIAFIPEPTTTTTSATNVLVPATRVSPERILALTPGSTLHLDGADVHCFLDGYEVITDTQGPEFVGFGDPMGRSHAAARAAALLADTVSL